MNLKLIEFLIIQISINYDELNFKYNFNLFKD